MRTLGTLSGNGAVEDESTSQEICKVSYNISVFKGQLSKSAVGTIVGRDDSLFLKLFDKDLLTLRLADGERIKFICQRISDGEAEISVTGPVPGY